jgi:LytS/YehU family sensor histidine kinase
MRLILENSPKEFIPIAIEEEILNKYLTTQKSRFENRFNFVIHIEENLFFKRAMIPPMITQPFIENAIEHGQLHTVENGLITISFKENNNLLEISITDNGIGRLKAGKKKKNKTHNSMALNITNERIQILNKKYKSKGSLTIQDLNQENNSGTSILIYLPIIYETSNFIQDEKGTNN